MGDDLSYLLDALKEAIVLTDLGYDQKISVEDGCLILKWISPSGMLDPVRVIDLSFLEEI